MHIVVKMLVAALTISAILIGAGVSGFTFYLWPTSFSDQQLSIDPTVLEQLTKLKSERKFTIDKSTMYFGAPNEESRAQAQAAVDAVIDSLLTELPRTPKRSVVLSRFKFALSNFSTTESEERDQFLVYLQRIMAIVGINDSNELFNVWRYGFPYGWILGR